MPVALVKPVALAVIVTLAVPSVSVLSGAVMANVAEDEPAGMVTVAGTVRREVLFDESEITRAYPRGAETETVRVPAEPLMSEPGTASARLVLSLSCTLMAFTPSVQF